MIDREEALKWLASDYRSFQVFSDMGIGDRLFGPWRFVRCLGGDFDGVVVFADGLHYGITEQEYANARYGVEQACS